MFWLHPLPFSSLYNRHGWQGDHHTLFAVQVSNPRAPHFFPVTASSRFPGGFLDILKVLLYTPIGLVLFALRILLGLLVLLLSYSLPDTAAVRKVVNKLLCATFGIVFDVVNLEKKEDVPVYMSNYVSPLDYLAARSVVGCVSVSIGINDLRSCGRASYCVHSAELLLKSSMNCCQGWCLTCWTKIC